MENKGAIGKITQVISAVLDIKFPEGHLPEINDAIRIPLKKGGELIVEVAQHLGDDTVRCIALGPTDGLVRGMDAIATGGPISVPVGDLVVCLMCWESQSMKLHLRRPRSTGRFIGRHLRLRNRQLPRKC